MTSEHERLYGTPGGRNLPPRTVLAEIRLLVTDVDGVLTDGRIHFDHEGREYKQFHVHDAAGIIYWHRCGGRTAFVSGRGGDVVRRRAEELGVHELHLGRIDKAAVFAGILQRQGLTAAQCAFVGDDLLDLPILTQVGFAVTVPEGRREVKRIAHYVTETRAGFGAVREVIEVMLTARGQFDAIVAKGGHP